MQFDGSASSDTEAPIFAHRWTFHDGSTQDGLGDTRSYPQDGLFALTLEVTDTVGSVVTDAITVTVQNLPPQITEVENQFIGQGSELTVATSFSDPGVLDTHTATIDWGDGSAIQPALVDEAHGAGTVSASHVYQDDGPFFATLTVTDDGGAQATTTFKVITGTDLHDGILYVGGTEGNDRVRIVQEGENLLLYATFLLACRFRPFSVSAVNQIVVDVRGGDDEVTIALHQEIPAIFMGGPGNDQLWSEAGPDILIGGNGNDLLNGSDGRDLLIGGSGIDWIGDTTGEDILVAGQTKYDNWYDARSRQALNAIIAQWNAPDIDYATRIDNLRNGTSGILTPDVRLVAGDTVLNDGDIDYLVGAAGLDWFFANVPPDVLWDRTAPEQVDGSDQAPVAPTIVGPIPPRIINVKVGSTAWTAAFRSAVDPARQVGYSLATGLDQPGPLPWTNIDQLVIQFSEDVWPGLRLDSIRLLGVNKRDYTPWISGLHYDTAAHTATVELSCSIGTDKLLLVVSDKVTDTAGNKLDGEWIDGASSLPSGDGTLGGAFQFRVNVLPGDTNRSGSVAVNDLGPLRAGLGSRIGDANYNPLADRNGSGSIAINDLTPLRSNLGKGLPAAEPVVPDGSIDSSAVEQLATVTTTSPEQGYSEPATSIDGDSQGGNQTAEPDDLLVFSVGDDAKVSASSDSKSVAMPESDVVSSSALSQPVVFSEDDPPDGILSPLTSSVTTFYVDTVAPPAAESNLTFGDHLVAPQPHPSVPGAGGAAGLSNDGDQLNGQRTYIWDQGAQNDLNDGIARRNEPDFAMMVWDMGSHFDSVRLYTHQDHYSGGFQFVATDALGQSTTELLTVSGVEQQRPSIDFDTLSDVSARLKAEYGRTSFNERTDVLYADLRLRNAGSYAVDTPLLVGITNISDSTIRVRQNDGMTPDDVPFSISRSLSTGLYCLRAS